MLNILRQYYSALTSLTSNLSQRSANSTSRK
jgi:hypothetical protein